MRRNGSFHNRIKLQASPHTRFVALAALSQEGRGYKIGGAVLCFALLVASACGTWRAGGGR